MESDRALESFDALIENMCELEERIADAFDMDPDELFLAGVRAWLDRANREYLIAHGVIAAETPPDEPHPAAGQHASDVVAGAAISLVERRKRPGRSRRPGRLPVARRGDRREGDDET